MRIKSLSVFIACILLYFSSQASHIVGGNMGYAYLGLGPNNTFRYKIILTTYTDCSPSSEMPFPEVSVSIGVYDQNLSLPNSPKVLKHTLNAPLIFSETITPPLPPGCSIGLSTCIYKGIYEIEVLLESSAAGYHIYYERCCRNTALVNILNPAQTSTGFYAFIPPTSIINSSPVFLDDPVPLLCVGDSLFLLNTAVDPDGDMLLYSFTTPYAGFANTSNPAPPAQPLLQWPITPVIYQNNFSVATPFGPGSYTYINALNGLSVYKSSLTGNFAVGVQVSEYRNGNLISATRRDMQIISLVCPINNPPVGIFPASLSMQIVEGDTTCFDFYYNDPDVDSVFLEAGGEPFLQSQPAGFTQEYITPSSIHGNICWVPPCGSARTLPYFITYKSWDDGCIPKERINIMQITVIPDTAQMYITGDTLACALQAATYQTNKTTGTFQWTVTNGAINPTSNESSAVVEWNLPLGQTGIINVIRDGICHDDTASLQIRLSPPQFAGKLGDIWLCPGSSEMLNAEPGGTNYQWSPGNWLSDSTIFNPITNTPDSIIYFVTYHDSVGCEKYDSLLVAVNTHIPVDAGGPISVCEGMSIVLGGSPTGPSNAAFQWSPSILFLSDTVPNPQMDNPQAGWYYVNVSVDTCHGIDSTLITVLPIPLANAGNDTTFCFGTPVHLHGTGSGNITWNPMGTNIDDIHDGNSILSAIPGLYSPILTVISNDGCMASDTVVIEILQLPNVQMMGNGSICRGDTVLYTASGAQSYSWSSDAFLSSYVLPSVNVYTDSSVWIHVSGVDINGCTSSDSLRVTVFRANLSYSSDSILCLGDSISLSFASPASIDTYWSPTDYLSSSNGQTVISLPTSSIVYTARAINEEGCTDSASVSLIVNPLPVLVGSVQYESMLFCDYIEIKASSNNLNDSLYWLLATSNGGEGNHTTLHINPTHPETIFLVGTTQYGCIDTLAINPQFSTLEQLLPVEFPNIITPNGDYINDTWNPSLPEGFADCMHLMVFNRWGNTVFDSNTFPIVWDAKTSSAKSLSDGVYFYVLEIGGLYKKGTITVVK